MREPRAVNWLRARPWRWRYRVMYRHLREEQRNPFTGRLLEPAHGRLGAAWLALAFPHVHDDDELDA